MADPKPQTILPSVIGTVADGDQALFKRDMYGAVYLKSGGQPLGLTGPSGGSPAGAAGLTGPTGAGSTITAFNPADKDPSITLSNSNLSASIATGGWVTARCVGPYKSSGKAYFRTEIVNADFIGPGFCTSGQALNTLIGTATASGVCGFSSGDGNLSAWYNGAVDGHGPSGVAVGGWIVVAMDLGAGAFWLTYQTSGGSLNTNWNNGANSPSAGTGGIATALGGVLVVPGCSLFASASGPEATIDCQTVIADATLSGFVPWSHL